MLDHSAVLDTLRIRGLALLDDVAIDFQPGMNVLTGETGAGKSIIVDALALLRGGRGRADLVRQGEEQARVQAQFVLDAPARADAVSILERLGLDLADGDELLIERSIARSGRGRSSVQANLTTVDALAQLGEHLVDICSQHEHHSLTHVGRHLYLLDAYAGLDPQREEFESAYDHYTGLRDERIRLEEALRTGSARIDWIQYQLAEIDRVDPQPGEEARLKERVVLLREASKLSELSAQTDHVLYSADSSVASQLGALAARARKAPRSIAAVNDLIERLEEAQGAIEEARAAGQALMDALDFEGGELEGVEERLHALDRLKRKHGCELEELATRRQQMSLELEELTTADDRLAKLTAAESDAHRRCMELAMALGAARIAASEGLGRAVAAELSALHMPSARMSAQVTALPNDELTRTGCHRVEFLFSANVGEPMAPLHKVASGGELSRVLLAVKGVLATEDRVTTYVFDEVDAGVGGAVAESIGRRLKAASMERQILCITHLPQIAAFADGHFRVEKIAVDGRTVTRVRPLSPDERVEELARMLAGAKVTQSARDHARGLIESAAEVTSTLRQQQQQPSDRRTATTKSPARSDGASTATPAATPASKKASANAERPPAKPSGSEQGRAPKAQKGAAQSGSPAAHPKAEPSSRAKSASLKAAVGSNKPSAAKRSSRPSTR